MKVLIMGANGGIGRRLVSRLHAEDDVTVRAMVREEEQRPPLLDLGVEAVLGDLEGEFAGNLDGCDAIVFSIGSGGSTGLDKTLMVDLWGARRAVDAAVDAGVERFVLVSSLGTADPRIGPSDLQPYLVAKRAADDHLASTGLDYTILRPGGLTEEPGTGKVQTRVESFGSIPRDDVAEAIAACLTNHRASRRVVELVSGDTPVDEALAAL